VVALDEGSITSVVERTLDKLLLSLTGTLVLGIAGIVYLSGFHVRKLEDLLGVVRHVADGDLTARVCGFGRDEIGSLAREFNRMMAKLEEGQDRLEASFRETVSALAAAIEARDAYTGGHCERVGRICRAIGERIGLSESDLQELELAAILHDVGKIGIDEAILGKQGPLALPEKEGMRRHAEIGSHILSRLSFMERVGIYVRHHHEYYDGSGYPDGLADKDIPLASRILAVVDAFDAMTTTRAYRGALPKDEAVRRVRSARGSQFDPSVVDAFLACNAAGTIDQICADHRAAAA
jgi:HD-GYP domain-containing protein (c-di-GMP phosphodiesterase class II)